MRAALALPLPLAALLAADRPAATPTRPPLQVRVSVDGAPADSAMRVVDPSASRDTVWVRGPGALVARLAEPVEVTTFIAAPGRRLRAVATDSVQGAFSAEGEMIVAIRTPAGAQLQAMPVPDELRRR